MTSSAPDQSDSDKTTPTFEDLRKQDVPYDFIIKVGDESIHTHQKILILQSEYFRAMLTHDTKEKLQGFVEIENVSLDDMRECVEFMYTRETYIKSILQAADMMRLLKVKEKCQEFLNKNLQLNNCVSTLNLISKYFCPDIQNKSQRMYDRYFDITLSELLELSMEDFIEYYESHTITNEIAWDGILNWIKYESETRSGFVFKLVELLDWDEFPAGILLRRLWSDSLFRNSQPCRKLLFEILFLDLDIFEANLSVENFFILKKLSREFEYVIKQFKLTLWIFLKRNIILLSSQSDFMSLDSSEILSLFLEEKHEIFAPEKWWWNTAILWVNEDSSRKKNFPRLMRSIRFDHLPRFFVDTIVRNEPMIIESKECLQILINALYTQVIEKETEASLVLLYSDGRIRSLKLESEVISWKNLTVIPETCNGGKIFHFNGKLCLINSNKLFYLSNNKWIEKCSLPVYPYSKIFCGLDEFICVIYGKKMFYYNSSKDTWNETALRDSFGTIYNIAAIDGCLYTIGIGRIRKYDVEEQVWSYVLPTDNRADIAAKSGRSIYTFGDKGIVNKFHLEKGFQHWKTLPEATAYQSCYQGQIEISVPAACGKFALDLDGRVMIVTGKKIFIQMFGELRSIKNLPEYVTGTKESQSTICATSACLAFTNVDIASQL